MRLQKHYNIPVFLPEKACPFRCIYCNQKAITGINGWPDKSDVKDIIEKYLRTIDHDNAHVDIAFFGGNFTGMPQDEQLAYLSLAAPYLEKGMVKGIRISTRPDYINNASLKILKYHGVKTIELGVQSMADDVLSLSGRGYDSACVKNASELILSHGFVLGLQMMTGLPGDNHEKALETARAIIACGASETRIYPLIVLRNTLLEKLYNEDRYIPQSINEAVFTAKELLKLFIQAEVKVLKIGLHPSKELSENAAVIAGPYHPSFAELVYTALWEEKIKRIEADSKKQIVIAVNPKDYNHIIGFKAANQKLLSTLYKTVTIGHDVAVKRYTWAFFEK